MSVIQQYKCPCCGGAIEFDSKSQKLKCPYCDSEFDIDILNEVSETSEKVSAEDKMDNWNTDMNNQWDGNDTGKIHTYICQSCGGEVIGDENTGSVTCPYCDNNIVLNDKFSNMLRPDLIIPFKLDKKAAKEALTKHLSDKKLLPKLFKDKNHIDEIKGVYVPFWVYDADIEGGVKYSATTVRCWSSGDYNYTETKYFDIYREGGVAFQGIPVDASSKMADDLMDSIEPYNLSEAVDFNTAYLAGYLADKYDVTPEEDIPRINTRVKQSTEDIFRTTVNGNYDSVTVKDSFVHLQNGSAKYALLPVWILNTTWNGEKYVFAMNGQTGKFVGNLPEDKKLYRKYWIERFLITAPFAAAVAFLIQRFFG